MRQILLILSLLLPSSTLAQAPSPAPLAGPADEVRGLLGREQVAEALAAAQAALAAHPDDAALHAALGDVFFRKGQMPEAEGEYRRALKLEPRTARAWLGLGRIAECVAMRKTAGSYFRRAHELDDRDPAITRAWIGTLPGGGQRVTASEAYLKTARSLDGETLKSVQQRLALEKELGERKAFTLASSYVASQMELEPMLVDLRHFRGYGLKVSFNEGKPERLLVDTGASGILINSELAEKVGAKRIADVDVHGIGDEGAMGAYTALVDKVKIGSVEFRNCVVVVSKRKSVAGESGLIGTDVFRKFLITLDFPKHTLRLDPLPGETADADWDERDRTIAPEMKEFTPVFQFSDHLLIQTVVGKQPPALFMIDTGAGTTLMSAALARAASKLDESGDITIKGASGSVKNIYTTNEVEIQFSHFRRRYSDMISFDFSQLNRDFGTEISGVLGMPILNFFTLKIDYRDGLVDFQYQKP